MSLDLLDPYTDVIFKLLLLGNRALLRDMLDSVLELPDPIQDQLVLNPEVPKVFSPHYEFVLDVWLRLRDDRKLVVRIQTTAPQKTNRNYLWQWARGFVASSSWARERTLFEPRIFVLWSRGTLSRSLRFHSVFQLVENESRDLFGPELEFHVLNLANIPSSREEPNTRVLRWARFLNAKSMAELDILADADAVMAEAKMALLTLSADPEAQRLAKARGCN